MKAELTDSFFTDDEKRRIAERVAAVELTTAGEVVPVVIDQSSDYPEAILVAALGMSFILSLLSMLLAGHDTIWYFIPLMMIFFVPARLVVRRYPRLALPFVSPRRRETAVYERAFRAFYDLGLHRTRRESGIMIFISILERKAWIFADKGINDLIEERTWEGIVSRLTGGLSRGERCQALCNAIDDCGAILASHLPPDDSNPDELANDMVTIRNKEIRT